MDTTLNTPTTAPKRRRRGLAVAVVLTGLVAAAPGVATLAGFTAQDVNSDNEISSGTLDVAFGQDSEYFDVQNMKPGDKTAQSVAVVNTGSLSEDFVLDIVDIDGELDDVLTVAVSEDGKVLTEGTKLSEMRTIASGLGSGEKATYDVVVSWPENAPEIDNKYQGAKVGFDLQVDATQLTGQEVVNGANAGN